MLYMFIFEKIYVHVTFITWFAIFRGPGATCAGPRMEGSVISSARGVASCMRIDH